MIGPRMAPTPAPKHPSREEVEARLEALLARLPSRRVADGLRDPANPREISETEVETMARLAALEARVNRSGGPR